MNHCDLCGTPIRRGQAMISTRYSANGASVVPPLPAWFHASCGVAVTPLPWDGA